MKNYKPINSPENAKFILIHVQNEFTGISPYTF